jgi:hypothetical protein
VKGVSVGDETWTGHAKIGAKMKGAQPHVIIQLKRITAVHNQRYLLLLVFHLKINYSNHFLPGLSTNRHGC